MIFSDSDQKQEMILEILYLFSVNYKFDQHLNLITTQCIRLRKLR
jgi:hypothetical protein